MERRYIGAVSYAIAVALVYLIAQRSGELLALITDVLFVLTSGGCTAIGLMLLHKWGTHGRFGRLQVGMFAAVFLWFLGETTWTIYEAVLGVAVPYPSVADVFYLSGYFPAVLAMIGFLLFFGKGLTRRRSLVAMVSGLIVIVFTYVFLVQALIASPTDFLTKVLDVGYPVLNAILMTLAIFMFSTLRGGRIRAVGLGSALGMLLTGIADISFSLGTLEGWYYSGHPIELLWLWGYISLAMGFEEQRTGIAVGAS